jgi:hypothetical protein
VARTQGPAAERRRQDRPHREHDTHGTAHVRLKVTHTRSPSPCRRIAPSCLALPWRRASSGDPLRLSPRSELKGGPSSTLHAGLDLSRRKLDVSLLSDRGEHLDQLVVPPDADGLKRSREAGGGGSREPVCAAIESMTGARFVHDTLEQAGWEVEIADAQRVKELAPLACKTDRIDSQMLATLSLRDWSRRSGFPIPGFARSASWPASGCIWSSTSPHSSAGSTRP